MRIDEIREKIKAKEFPSTIVVTNEHKFNNISFIKHDLVYDTKYDFHLGEIEINYNGHEKLQKKHTYKSFGIHSEEDYLENYGFILKH